jgi:osmotically-inducible protein OsmY
LVRSGGRLLRGAAERVLPAEQIALVDRTGVVIKLGREGLAALPIYRPDPAIVANIQVALEAVLAEPRARRAVKVRVEDGHVSLAGVVDTVEQERYAVRAVTAVPGVRGLTNDLVVDETLAAEVEARIASLVAAASNGRGQVRVLSEHGIVYLEGSVRSAGERDAIERAALSAAGARVVVNSVQVDGEPPNRAPGTGPLVRNR